MEEKQSKKEKRDMAGRREFKMMMIWALDREEGGDRRSVTKKGIREGESCRKRVFGRSRRLKKKERKTEQRKGELEGYKGVISREWGNGR